MPTKSPKPCAHPACRALTTDGAYCAAHKKQQRQRYESKRESSTKRLYGYKWQQARAGFLKKHPLCHCDNCKPKIEQARLATDLHDTPEHNELLIAQHPELAANVVDHIIPHNGDQTLFWARSNWQAMNKRCHDKKTAKEDGGFTGKSPSAKGGGDQKSTAFYL